MCGIAGIIANNAQQYDQQLHAMLKALAHRGPDDEGVFISNKCCLGHRRLSIVDISTGQQPMACAKKQRQIVFNGEIYGYQTIHNRLKNKYPFRTKSDTEVILALYDEYGEGCVDHLPGMFSFALWDEERQMLFAARDRFGEKPFYYAFGSQGELIFASEIKAILATELFKPKIDYQSLVYYLQHLYVHPYKTIYSNVFVLPPGHYLNFQQGKTKVCRYWRLPETQPSISLGDACERFKFLFEQAVEKQMIADVPVGAFLSGGLDSSTVVAAASHLQNNVATYSFGFEDGVNELPYAREIAQKYGTEHQELTAENVDIAELLLKMDEIYDEPFADSSNIPTYLISYLGRKHRKVILTGDGGDELLGGYPWYQSLLDFGSYPKDSARYYYLLKLAIKGTRWLGFSQGKMEQQALTARLAYKHRTISAAHASLNTYFDEAAVTRLLKIDGPNGIEDLTFNRDSWFRQANNADGTLNDAMRMDLLDYMPGDILVKIDRASMANSLELRAPFLDVDFASFCISLPASLKLTKEEDKRILRLAYKDAWTDSIQNRKKQGFGAPVTEWLKRPSVAAMKEEVLINRHAPIYQIISYQQAERFVKDDNYGTWILLTLAIWLKNRAGYI